MIFYAKNVGEIALWTVLGWCVFPFIIPDVIKIVLALFLCKRLASVIKIN